MNIRIIADSGADLPEHIKDKVILLPLTIRFGSEEFYDGVTISNREFYQKLVETTEQVTTSQVTPQTFHNAFAEAVNAGDTVIAITVSSKLSGTYQSATIAAEDFPGKVYVVDSLTLAIGSGILIEYALNLIEKGMSAPEIVSELTKKRDDIRIYAVLDTLKYLKRSGRISKTAAFAGGVLSIKPLVVVSDGEIKPAGKARGNAAANKLMTELICAEGVDFSMPLLLGYTGVSDELLKTYAADSADVWEKYPGKLYHSTVGSAIGTHAGPNAVAAAFFKKN